MKLTDYMDAINAQLEVTRYACQNERWTASFDDCEVKDSGCLASIYGTGTDPYSAIADYVRQIVGKKIVFGAMRSDARRELVVPEHLTGIEREGA